MKKRFILVVLAALLSFGAAGCEKGNEPGPGPEPTPTPVAQYTVSITNKDALQGEWRLSDGAKKVEIAVDPAANVGSLIAEGTIVITSSNEEVVSVMGQNIVPNGLGKATITVKCGESVDTAEIEILDRQHGTFEEDPLTVEEAVATAKALAVGATSTIVYYVTGIVESNSWDAGYKNGTIWLSDGTNKFELYRYTMDEKCKVDPATITPGMIVTAYGNIQNYENKTFEMTAGCKVVSALENTIPCTDLTVDSETMTLEANEVGRITATATPSTTTDTLEYTVTDSKIATVSPNGRVTGVSDGETKVTVKCGEQTKEVTVTVVETTAGPKTLEKIDRLSTEGILPTAKPSAVETKVVEQLVPGQLSTVKAVFDGQWCVPGLGTYEGAMQSNNLTDSIHGDAEASLYVHKIRLDIRKYVNVEVFKTNDCTGAAVNAVDVSGTAGIDEHVIKEYTINGKAWSIKANYSGASYLHSVQLTVDSEPMVAEFTGVEFPRNTVSLLEDQSFNAAVSILDEGVTGVAVSYESSAPELVSVSEEGVVTALGSTGTATITATGSKGGVEHSAQMRVNCVGANLPAETPAAETLYLFGVMQKGLGKFLYSTGAVSGNYAATTELCDDAAQFELVAVEGGYNIKVTLADGSTKYMNYTTSENGDKSYANIKFEDSARVVWVIDAEKVCLKTQVTEFTVNTKNNDWYYVGAYGTNATLSMSKISYLTPGSTNYAAWFYTLGETPAVTSVTVDPESVTLVPEKTKQLSATVLPELASQKIVWATDAPAVATVDENGLVTAVADGTARITATSKNGVVGTCTVTVDSATGGGTETETLTATAQYTGTATGNMDGTNQASALGVKESAISIVGSKTNGGQNNVGLNKDGTMRLYKNNTSTITISITGGTIVSLKVNFGATVGTLVANGESNSITANGSITLDIDDTSVALSNGHASSQTYIKSIEINYSLN